MSPLSIASSAMFFIEAKKSSESLFSLTSSRMRPTRDFAIMLEFSSSPNISSLMTLNIRLTTSSYLLSDSFCCLRSSLSPSSISLSNSFTVSADIFAIASLYDGSVLLNSLYMRCASSLLRLAIASLLAATASFVNNSG